ncbi:MAG TPA: hypothetical protein VG838_02170 [Opitutaceae bacterium]|nr:hypothetical protein [Opitutaceae bacterium]
MATTAGFPRSALTKAALLLLAFLPLVGCLSSVTARKAPKADLSQLKHIFVEHRLNDNHRMDELIVQELQALGYDAASGPLTMASPETDAVITYEDQWTYDFTSHLIGFSLVVTDNLHHRQLAEGSYYRPSVTHMAPAEMIHLTVLKVFRDR